MGRRVLTALLALAAAGSAPAQQYGQWWIDGRVSAEARRYDNWVDGREASRYDQRRFRLDLALNGYVLHPALAEFRLELQGVLDRYRDGLGLDSNRSGARLELRLLPRSWHPIRVWAGRTTYSYATEVRPGPGTFLPAIPDTQTAYGARLRLRRGPLRGTLFGVDHSTLRFVDGRSQRDQRQFVDWAHGGGSLQRHYRLEHRVLDYASLDYTIDDWTFTGDEHGEIGRGWRWDMTAIGIRRDFRAGTGAALRADVLSVANRLTRSTARRGLLTLGYTLGWSASNGISTSSHQVEGRWEFDLGRGWRVGPYAAAGYQAVDGRSGSNQLLGALATWGGMVGRFDGVFSGQVALGRLATSGAAGDRRFLSAGLSWTIGHGDETTLRKELELALARSDTSSQPRPEEDLPDLGASLAAGGTADSRRVRLTLRRRFGRITARSYAEVRRRESDLTLRPGSAVVAARLYSLEVSAPRVSLAVFLSELDARTASRQRVDAASVNLVWRPWRPLSFQATYRTDTRQLELVPDVDGEQLQGTVTFQMGLLHLRGEYFDSRERVTDGSRRRNRGVVVVLSRRFGSLLPIVTAPQRRGVIR